MAKTPPVAGLDTEMASADGDRDAVYGDVPERAWSGSLPAMAVTLRPLNEVYQGPSASAGRDVQGAVGVEAGSVDPAVGPVAHVRGARGDPGIPLWRGTKKAWAAPRVRPT